LLHLNLLGHLMVKLSAPAPQYVNLRNRAYLDGRYKVVLSEGGRVLGSVAPLRRACETIENVDPHDETKMLGMREGGGATAARVVNAIRTGNCALFETRLIRVEAT
jgi:hypothetical protein